VNSRANPVILKANDVGGHQFESTITENGTALPLTGATVLFLFRLEASPYTAYSFAATIVSASAGTVKYIPTSTFPTAEAMYLQEWEVTFSPTDIRTFPSGKYNYVKIIDDLN
jgi:hypothetical protein